MWDVPFELIQVGLDISVATELLFSVATALTKLSMLSLTYRVVTQGSGNLWKYIVASMVLVVAQSTTFCFVVIFQCKYVPQGSLTYHVLMTIFRTPAAYLTLTWHPQPACLSETAHLLAAGIVNVITDILVVGLPMPMVLKLKLPKRQQIAVAFLFGVGLLVTLAGAARCVYLYETTTQWDKTWLAYPVYICSSVELFVGIVSHLLSAHRFRTNSTRYVHLYLPRKHSLRTSYLRSYGQLYTLAHRNLKRRRTQQHHCKNPKSRN
jgi:hypothetical protein